MARYSGTSMIAVDGDARVTMVVGESNHAVAFDPQNAVGHTIDSYFVNDPDHAKLYHAALKNQPQKVTFRAVNGDFYEAQIVPLLDGQNKICGAFSFENDVTEREKAITAHREQEERLEHLFQNTEDGIYLLGRDFIIQRANTAAASIHNIQGRLEGHVCHQKIFGRDKPCDFCPVVTTLHTGKSAETTYYDEGLQKHLQLRSTPFFNPLTGELTGVLEAVRDVSDKMILESAIQTQESFITDVLASISEGVFVIDPSYTIIKTNPAFEAMYSEYAPLMGKKCFITSCLDRVCDDCPATIVFETGKTAVSTHYEHPTDTRPGVWLEHYAYPITVPSGEVVAAICIIRDVTQRKEHEDALEQYRNNLERLVDERTRNLEQSESKMRTIIAGGNVPIAFGSPDGVVTFANTAFQTLTGYSESELVGARFWNTIYDEHTKTNAQFLELRANLYAGKLDQHRQDITIRRKDGEIRWVDFTASAVNDSGGERLQIIFIFLDITTRYKMVQAIAEANELARIMLDTAPLGCTLFNKEGNVLDCNTEAHKLFDIPSQQEYCNRFFDLLPTRQPDGQLSSHKFVRNLAMVFETGYVREEWMHQKLDGTPVPCEITSVRVKRGDDYIAVCYAKDLRQYKKMLADVHEANERAQLMLDANPIACTLINRENEPIDCNLETVRLFELNNKQEYYERFLELVPEYQPNGQLTLEMRREKCKRAFETGYQRYEWLYQKFDGTPLPCEVTLVRIQYEGDYILAGYVRDLREHKEMLARIHDANERTQVMLDATPLGCSVWDEELNHVDCNQAMVKLFGLSSKQEFFDRFFELSPEYQPNGQRSSSLAIERLKAAFETGYLRDEHVHQLPDGTPVPCEITLVRVPRGDGYNVCGYIRDLREQRAMLAKIYEANERTHIMLDATPLGCSVWDEELNHVDCNQAMVNLFGLSRKQEFADRFLELSPQYQPNGQSSTEMATEQLAMAFKTGYQRFEYVHQLFDGTPIPCEITLVRVPWENGYNVCVYVRDLREHQAMLAKIHEANERTQIMLDANPLGCQLWNDLFETIDCNMAAVNMFGFKNKQEYVDRFFELLPEYQPDGQLSTEMALGNLKVAFATGYQRFEPMQQLPDGTPFPCEITLVRIPQENGYIVCGYTRDLREHNKMLAQIHEANERTHLMLDATPLCCQLWDEDLNTIDCNMAAVRLYDFKDKQEYVERFSECSPTYQPDGRLSSEKAVTLVKMAFETGYQRFEWIQRKPDGTPIPAEITLVRVQHGNRNIVAGYTRDLREYKKHEAELERDRQRTNALLELAQMAQQPEENISDYVIRSIVSLTDSDLGYVVQLEHAADVLPFRSIVIDQSHACALPTMTEHGTPHTLSPVLTECLTTKQVVIHDDFLSLPGIRTFPEGHHQVYSHMNAPIMDGEHPVGIVGVGNKKTPYTEMDAKQLTLIAQGLGNLLNRKKYAEKLEKAKIEADKANKAKSEFLAHMSHEIRTPLNGVIGLSDLLSSTPLNEKQREYVRLINTSGNSLLFLINDILDFSKIEAGKLDIDHEPFDLSATISSVLASLAPRASEKHLELAVSFCRDLPRIVEGDSGRIRQILLNLAGNAVKFTNCGGVRIDIVVESISEASLTVKFSVIDTGIGIPQSGIDRLFKAFSQVDASSARNYGGTGLGLAISMQLVRLMNGDIGVESEAGKGSVFWFKIPFGCSPDVLQCLREKKCSEILAPDCPNIDGQYCTIFINRNIPGEYCVKGQSALVVDDNEIHRDALRIQLENWGMKCTTCDSGEEAIQLAQQHHHQGKPFDLFILDSTLSDGAGIDLARQLFDQEEKGGIQTVHLILLRALSDDFEQDIVDDIRTEVVNKPVFASALFDAIISRIFAAKRQEGINSGAIDPNDSTGTLPQKPKLRWKIESAKQFPNSANRLKSRLAGKVHILVVEDNKVNQIVAKNLLIEAGFTCDLAQTGIEACSAVRNKKYDIVLMDCQMPEMDGFEATHLIRNWEREYGKKSLPIIALTANATKDDVRKCLDAGMDAYCSKPIDPQAVIRLIETWYEKNS